MGNTLLTALMGHLLRYLTSLPHHTSAFCGASISELRFLFVLLIREGAPALPLWERFANDLAMDYSNSVDPFVPTPAKMLALEAIERLLQEHGKSTLDFALPRISIHSAEIHHEFSYFAPQAHTLHATAQANLSRMTPNQLSIYNKLYHAAFSSSPQRRKLHFLTGKAGRGKSSIIDTLVAMARSEGAIPIVMGTSALSVSNIDHGQTAHYMCRLPVTNDNTGIVSSIPTNSDRADLLRAAAFIMWDELPMANVAVFEAVDILLQHIMDVDEAFGGKVVIGIGDFRQVAPVVKGGGPTATYLASILSSPLWKSFSISELSEPIRNAADPSFADFINNIGEDVSLRRIILDDWLERTDNVDFLST